MIKEYFIYLLKFFHKATFQLAQSIFYFIKSHSKNFLNILTYGLLLILIYFLIKLLITHLLKFALKIKQLNHITDRVITLSSVINSIMKVFLVFAFILLILVEFKIKIIPIITGAGVVGAAIVFIFQSFIQDIIKGWILIFEDQIRKGEWVNINNTYIGEVRNFNLRYLTLRDKERNLILIPNSQILTIVNLSRRLKIKAVKVKVQKPENLDNFFEKIKNFLADLKNNIDNLIEITLAEDFYLTNEFLEFKVLIRSKYLYLEEVVKKVKLAIYDKFTDILIELE